MTDSITVTLAGNDYTIGMLTIGQQRDLAIGVVLPDVENDPQESIRRAFNRNLAILAAGLAADHPDMTVAALLQMRGVTSQERVSAVNTILEFAGLVEKKPGEAAAATAAA